MDSYPPVHGEFETIDAIRAGGSLARFGDGEMAVMHGHPRPRQPTCPKLAAELQAVIRSDQCLIGIPAPNPKADKHLRWRKKYRRFPAFLTAGREYYSVFISRVDWAPWLRTREYAEHVQSIWLDKRVAVIAPRGSLLPVVIQRDSPVVHIQCPSGRGKTRTYEEIDNLEHQALGAGADIVIISAGFTATCLAHRLAPYVQAVDIGSIGKFLWRTLKESGE